MKTSELEGAALDYAVRILAQKVDIGAPDGTPVWREFLAMQEAGDPFLFPSTLWEQGGPIIEREGITTGPWDTSPARAIKGHNHDYKPTFTMVGPTMLIAAMRCYVASRLGEHVDIPKELML